MPQVKSHILCINSPILQYISASLYKERGFPFEPSSVEDAQRLWEMDKQRMDDTLRRQKQEMMADSQWLENKEKLLVSEKNIILTFFFTKII